MAPWNQAAAARTASGHFGLASTPAARVQASAYRIVQESLANVVRHAGPARATVTVERVGVAVRVAVSDDGPGPAVAAPGGGLGIEGMRARAEQLGGTLAAGPLAGGGWSVEAVLPIAATRGV